MIKSTVFAGLLASAFFAASIRASAVYYNREDWQQAINLTGSRQMVSVSLADADWSQNLNVQPGATQRVSFLSAAASSGVGVSAISGYSQPGIADNATLGHVAGGLWTDVLSKYGETTFTFSGPIHAFGGDFTIAGQNGLFISSVGEVGGGRSGYTGFIGFILDQPTNDVLISWGDDAQCPYCFGNSYTLANLAVDTVSTPEPNYRFAIAGLFIALASVIYSDSSAIRDLKNCSFRYDCRQDLQPPSPERLL